MKADDVALPATPAAKKRACRKSKGQFMRAEANKARKARRQREKQKKHEEAASSTKDSWRSVHRFNVYFEIVWELVGLVYIMFSRLLFL